MNLKILQQNKKTKYLFYFVLLLPFIIIPLLLSNTKPKTKTDPSTIPVIPDTTNKNIKTSSSQNLFGTDQKLVFNWGDISPNLQNSLNIYKIITPIINTSTIVSLSNKFNFKSEDKSNETNKESYLWINKKGSLFGSTSQNQIFYNSKSEIPKHTSDISKDEAIDTAKKITSDLFGKDFTDSLAENPRVTYFSFDSKKIESEPEEVDLKTNTVVQIAFKQNVSELSTINNSRTGEFLYVNIDTTKKLQNLSLYGGFQNILPTGTEEILNYNQLKELATSKAIRVTNSKDIGSESAYTRAKEIKVDVKSVNLGYFQIGETFNPVFIIEGTMSSKGILEFPATYIVPAIKSTPAPE